MFTEYVMHTFPAELVVAHPIVPLDYPKGVRLDDGVPVSGLRANGTVALVRPGT
jgi:hypothetical protein